MQCFVGLIMKKTKTYDRPGSPMHGWPLTRRMDPWAFPLLEAICPHGIGHPIPESVEMLEKSGNRGHWGVHGCDGCCFKEDSDERSSSVATT